MKSNPNSNPTPSSSSTMQSRLFNPVKISLSTHSSSVSTSESNSSPETNLKLAKQNSLRNPSLAKNKILNSHQNSSNIDFINSIKNETPSLITTSGAGKIKALGITKSVQSKPQQPASAASTIYKNNQVNLIYID
jgi:hypothetical protein